MNFRIIYNSFKADFRFISRDPMLLLASVAPVILIILMRFLFPLLVEYIYTKSSFNLNDYYPVVTITMVSLIPMLFGMVYAFILLDENDTHILQVISVTPSGKRNFLYMRMLVPALLSLVMVLITIFIIDPVEGEGWLRNIYISVLLASQAPFTFLLIGCLAGNKVEGLALSKLYGVFLVAVPLGLILHHPWNYIMFYSPLYWISWAWIIPSPSESLAYGAIALFITGGSIILLFRYFLNKRCE
ncbi:MAG TPA: hypothetical protein VMV47_12320 [Bacteroidales bacterium]|nr:hypothetical protein [Bacteroidales bacterium]